MSDTEYQLDDVGVYRGELGGALDYPLSIHSNAYESLRVVKSGPGLLYGFTVYNSKASAQFIQIFDVSTTPASGAIPACVFSVAASSHLPIAWLPGRAFNTGIVIANSSTGPTYTAGSADCFFDAQYL